MDRSRAKHQPSVVVTPSDVPVLSIESLLRGCREAVILHGAEQYRLRITASGKLILTK